jgi:hypothetical protein
MADLVRCCKRSEWDLGVRLGRDRSTSKHKSPELVAQVSQLEALLSRQRADLNDLKQNGFLPGQVDEEEDDDLAAEIAELWNPKSC